MKQRGLCQPVTLEQTLAAAAYTAAGLPRGAIARNVGITLTALRHINAREDWEVLIAWAEAEFEELLKGGAA